MRPAAAVRLRALGCLLLAGTAVAVASPGQVAAAPRAVETSTSLRAELEALSAEVEAVGVELARGAEAYDRAETELAELTQRQFSARADREALLAAETESRSALEGLARAAYKGGVPPMVTALLSGDPGAVSHLAYVQRSVNRVGATHSDVTRELASQQAGAGEALQRSDALRRQALSKRQALEAQRVALAEQTTQLTTRLQATMVRLAQVRAAELAAEQRARAAAELAARQRAAAEAAAAARLAGLPVPGVPGVVSSSGGLCQPPSGLPEVNGFLSDESLCPLSVGGGHRLRTDAAQAFEQLNAARRAATGSDLCVTDSYRDYAGQVDVFRRKPNLAATPGRSQHGWGLALDLCGGIQSFGSEAHRWMQANAPAYGWVHPTWARITGSKPEAWHWEYVGVVTAAR